MVSLSTFFSGVSANEDDWEVTKMMLVVRMVKWIKTKNNCALIVFRAGVMVRLWSGWWRSLWCSLFLLYRFQEDMGVSVWCNGTKRSNGVWITMSNHCLIGICFCGVNWMVLDKQYSSWTGMEVVERGDPWLKVARELLMLCPWALLFVLCNENSRTQNVATQIVCLWEYIYIHLWCPLQWRIGASQSLANMLFSHTFICSWFDIPGSRYPRRRETTPIHPELDD